MAEKKRIEFRTCNKNVIRKIENYEELGFQNQSAFVEAAVLAYKSCSISEEQLEACVEKSVERVLEKYENERRKTMEPEFGFQPL